MAEEEMRKILSLPEFQKGGDSTFPTEMISIHLKDYDLIFGED
jgi:hypothetical protein